MTPRQHPLKPLSTLLIAFLINVLFGTWSNLPAYGNELEFHSPVTYNMQGGTANDQSKWGTDVSLLSQNHDVVALQEAGSGPPQSSQLILAGQLRGLNYSVSRWNLGTTSRPNIRYIYFLETDPNGNRVNLAIVLQRQADAVDAAAEGITGRSRPALGVRLGNIWFYTVHGLASGGNDDANLLNNIAVASPSYYAALGDFNRAPGALTLPPGAVVYNTGQATQQSGGELDYMVSNDRVVCGVGNNVELYANRLGALSSDHYPIEFPNRPCPTPEPPPGAAATIVAMPLGDSITWGIGSSTGNGYRQDLGTEMTNDRINWSFVGSQSSGSMSDPANEGYPGKTIDFIGSIVPKVVPQYQPNLVLLDIGINDLGGSPPADPYSAASGIAGLIGQILTAQPDTAVLVATLIVNKDADLENRIEAFNSELPRRVNAFQQQGKHVALVHMDALTPDDLNVNLHPNDTGYQKMADAWNDGIQQVIKNGWVAPRSITGGGGGIGKRGFGNGTPGPPPPPGKWQPQGEIANGGGATLGSFAQMADINGDGRPDYLVVDKSGAVTGYLNAGQSSDGTWVFLLQPLLTEGFGRPGSQIRFADLNGDGRADYLAVDDNGAVAGYLNGGIGPDGKWVWLPTPNIAGGVGAPGSEVQFGDINGDGRADYLVVDKDGAVTASFNGGPAADGSGWTWPINIKIANGVNAPYGSQVQFADINGDGFDDYLVTSSIDGTTTAWMNGGQISSTEWNLYPVGQVAPGIGAPSLDLRPLFADLNGDGKADYLAVNRNTAAVSAFLNNGLDTDPVAGWLPLGPIAAGMGGPNIDIQMADIDGDGRADYIAVNTLNGFASGYLNGGQKTGGWIWFQQPKIAGGVGAPAGSTYRFADVNGDGKADYLVVGFLNKVDAYLSAGAGPDGWVYNMLQGPVYVGSSSWAGFGAAADVHFADIDGDGDADLLVFNNGNVKGLLNSGLPQDIYNPGFFVGGYHFDIAYSPGVSSNIAFANIDVGDPKRADYLAIGDGGSVTALLNEGFNGFSEPTVNWKSVGQILGGTAPPGSSVLFADINGDGRADYLVVDNNTGAITAWLNNGAGMNQ